MYVLARRIGESIVLADGVIEVKVLSIDGKIAKLGIDAPLAVSVFRKEVFLKSKPKLDSNEA